MSEIDSMLDIDRSVPVFRQLLDLNLLLKLLLALLLSLLSTVWIAAIILQRQLQTSSISECVWKMDLSI
jgi:hypothetical protein